MSGIELKEDMIDIVVSFTWKNLGFWGGMNLQRLNTEERENKGKNDNNDDLGWERFGEKDGGMSGFILKILVIIMCIFEVLF